ncbi:MAG: hypothetical protein QOK48_1276 [Blastocatellia bacterium]|nr:hypothetical protein [Blastocatellia bacterium]
MKLRKLNRKILMIVAGLMLLAAVPATNFAQGRGRGQGQGKKLDRFVNGHDARDGRWEGRGPRSGQGYRVSNVIRHRRSDRFRNGDFDRLDRFRNRRVERRRHFDNDNFLRSQRWRNRNSRFSRRSSNRY